jgi:DNA modification methylase
MWDGAYLFNRSKIIFGDCLEKMKLIPDNSVDFICADLPFGKTRNKWDKIIPSELLWPEVWRVCKENAAVLFFGQDKFTAMMMLSSKYHRYNIIWEKTTVTNHFNAKKMPLRCHEQKSRVSSTQKPVKLIEECVLTYSNKGDLVLDITSGSGTLGEACINTNRDFILIENDENEYPKGKKRIIDVINENGIDISKIGIND